MLVYERPSRCQVCDSAVEVHLQGVEDRVYGVPGRWNYVRCTRGDCEVIYLDHDLTADQLAGFYAGYSTHSPPVLEADGIKKLYRDALASVQRRRLGYFTSAGMIARVAGSMFDKIPLFRENALSRLFWLPAKAGGRALEVGFGNAQSMAQLREAGWAVTGCEFDDACVNQARNLGFDVHHGGLTQAGFAAASFDAVVASHTIEHVPDPVAFVQEAARLLAGEGRLVLLTPNAASRDARRHGRFWRGLEAPRHLTIHTPASLRRMAEKAGFVDIEVVGTPLAGFILQQTRDLSKGRVPARRQGFRTLRYNLRASLIAARRPLDSEEIVLRCRMPG